MGKAIETLLAVCEQQSQSQGVLRIRNSNTKQQGAFYLRHGKLYAAELDDFTPPYVRRLVGSGRVQDAQSLDTALKISGGEGAINFPFYVLQNMVVDRKIFIPVVRDFFYYAAGEILSWENVRHKWTRDDSNSKYQVFETEGGKVVEVVSTRSDNIHSFLTSLDMSYEEFLNEGFVTLGDAHHSQYEDELSFDEYGILARVKEEAVPIYALISELGFTVFSLFRSLYVLWKRNLVDLWLGETNLRKTGGDPLEELVIPVPTSDASATEAQAAPERDVESESPESANNQEPSPVMANLGYNVNDLSSPLGLDDPEVSHYVPSEEFLAGDSKIQHSDAIDASTPQEEAPPAAGLPAPPLFKKSANTEEPSLVQDIDLAALIEGGDSDQEEPDLLEANPESDIHPTVDENKEPISTPELDESSSPHEDSDQMDVSAQDGALNGEDNLDEIEVSSLVGQLQNVLKSIEIHQNAIQNRISKIRSKKQELSATLTALDTQKSDINVNIVQIEEQIQQLTDQLTAAKQQESAISSRRDAIQNESVALDNSLIKAEKDLAEITAVYSNTFSQTHNS